MAQDLVAQYRQPYPRPPSKPSYRSVDNSQSEFCFAPTPWEIPLTLPPMNVGWPSQYSPPTSGWDGLPAPHLPSPTPSNASRSLSPQSAGYCPRGSNGSSARTSPRRRLASASSATSWSSPQLRTLTPAPSVASSPPSSDSYPTPGWKRISSQQSHDSPPHGQPVYSRANIPGSTQQPPTQQPQPFILPRSTMPTYPPAPFTFQSGPSPTPLPHFYPVTVPPECHFLCTAAYDSCHVWPGSQYACETNKWASLVGRLSRLPPKVLQQICGQVDYERLILLRQLNRALRDNVDAQWAPYDSKISFVTYAEARFPQHWPGKLDKSDSTPANGGHGKTGSQLAPSSAQGKPLRRVAGPKHGRGQKAGAKRSRSDAIEDGATEETSNGAHPRPGNFGCYLECFKVLGPENFENLSWSGGQDGDSTSQDVPGSHTPGDSRPGQFPSYSLPTGSRLIPIRQVGLPNLWIRSNESQPTRAQRRCCIKCGVKYGYYKPGEYITRRLGERVWVCKCRRTHEYGVLNCRGCGSYCPFSPSDRRNR